MMAYLSKSAAKELLRQSAFSGIPGEMFADITSGGCSDYSLVISPGRRTGDPIARESGVTLFADLDKVKLFEKVEINYQESLAGGGFYITGETIDVCACGNCFSLK